MTKRYIDLEFTDDYMFCKVLGTHHDLTKRLAETILNRKIGNIVSLNIQDYLKDSYESKAVVLDVHFEDDLDTICTIEMQISNRDNIRRRSRYYLSITDLDSLNAGQNYDMLKNNYFVMICKFDLFGKGLAKYSFQNKCEECDDLYLEDGRYTVFLNTTGMIDCVASPELAELVHFLSTNEATGDLTNQIDECVRISRLNKSWERDYMLFIDRLRLEREEGKVDLIIQLYESGAVSIEQLAEGLQMPVAEIERIVSSIRIN